MVNTKERLLSQDEAAAFLSTTKKTLNTWRCSGKYHIPYIKWGNNIKYRLADLETWLNNHQHNVQEWQNV